MRFYPFGSGSFAGFTESASQALYSIGSQHGTNTLSSVWADYPSTGSTGDTGTTCDYSNGPYEIYPPT